MNLIKCIKDLIVSPSHCNNSFNYVDNDTEININNIISNIQNLRNSTPLKTKSDNLISKTRVFKLASLSITSLVKHIDELRVYTSDQELDILAINETRLDFDIPKELVSIQGYTWISRDRNRFGGGIGPYIRNTK